MGFPFSEFWAGETGLKVATDKSDFLRFFAAMKLCLFDDESKKQTRQL
jgi:hypothetical protein